MTVAQDVRLARFPGTCRTCQGAIVVGAEIDWAPGRGARHITCPVPVDYLQEPGILPGYYTVVLEDGEHRTFRIKRLDARAFRNEGRTRIALMTGSVNTSQYTDFGWVIGSDIEMLPVTYRANRTPVPEEEVRTWVRTAKGIFALTEEERKEAGMRYALASNRCYNCNKLLTHPESVLTGLGPDCAGRR